MKPHLWKLLTASIVAVPYFAFATDSKTEVEVDPIAYALNGYSLHLGESVDSWKFDVNTASESFSQSLTNTLTSNSDFKSKFTSYGAKIDSIGAIHVGFHVGIQWDYSRWTYTNVDNKISSNNCTQDAGIRFGYRWGSGALYLDPWIGFLYNYQGTGPVNVGGHTYNPQSF